jgi:hypothetical protein
MINAVSKQVAAKFWDGSAHHEFLTAIDLLVAGFRFEFGRHDNQAPCTIWRRELFPGYSINFQVWPYVPDVRPGVISMEFVISIASSRQRELFIDLGMHKSELSEIGILNISLNWLIAAWSSGSISFTEAFGMWKNIRRESFGSSLARLRHSLDCILPRLLQMIEDPKRLANTLCHLDQFPGKTPTTGPRSASPLEFAMVLLRDSGETPEAIRILDRLKIEKPASIGGGTGTAEDAQALVLHRIHAYEGWLRSN